MAKDKLLQVEFAADLGNYLAKLQYQEFDIQKSTILCDNEKTKLI